MLAARLAVVLLVVTVSATRAQDDREWTPAGQKNGVALSYRDDDALNAREVRAVAELPYAADNVIDLACDFTQPLDPDVRESRLLAGEPGGRYEIYLRYAPRYVVVSARDVVIDVRPTPYGCAWSEVADRVTTPPGTVRMPLLRGSWTAEPIDTARSRVTYQVAVRPGGSIPGWMVRRGAINAMPDVIARVSRCLSIPPTADGRCAAPPRRD